MEHDAILLVEDNDDDVILTKCTLEDAGIVNPVRDVPTADKAIAYLAGQGEYQDRHSYPMPCVIFIDLSLPGKSGRSRLPGRKRNLQHDGSLAWGPPRHRVCRTSRAGWSGD